MIWRDRVERAERLAVAWPWAAEVLGLFREITLVQEEIHGAIKPFVDPDWTRMRPEKLAWFADPILKVAIRYGPELLANAARELESWSPGDWNQRLFEYVHDDHVCADLPAEGFFLWALAHPYMVEVGRLRPPASGEPRGTCPVCEGDPAASILWEDVDAQSTPRRLVCGLCAVEWPFPRVVCPVCLEERPEKLPRLTAEEIPWVRVEACETCQTYVKAVDLTREPGAVAVVDALASLPLDLAAKEQGFRRRAVGLAALL